MSDKISVIRRSWRYASVPVAIGASLVALLTAEMFARRRKSRIRFYSGAAGGWGSARAVADEVLRERIPFKGPRLLLHQNKSDGFACVSCAWAKPKFRPLEFCENGAKATLWENDPKRATPEFFSRHRVRTLLAWTDHSLEAQGRLTHPFRWDKDSDRYLRVSWEQAFEGIGAILSKTDPESAVFYASGRASLETAYLYSLLARLYGCNNLPDCSNMCHESTSVALPESIGVPVGTVRLEDFAQTDCIFFFGQNVGSNSSTPHGDSAGGERAPQVRTVHRGGDCQGYAALQSAGGLGWLGRRLQLDPRRDRGDVS